MSNESEQNDKCSMNDRMYAAVQLRIPMSGDPVIDEMIRQASVRDAAVKILGGFSAQYGIQQAAADVQSVCEAAYVLAHTAVEWELQ